MNLRYIAMEIILFFSPINFERENRLSIYSSFKELYYRHELIFFRQKKILLGGDLNSLYTSFLIVLLCIYLRYTHFFTSFITSINTFHYHRRVTSGLKSRKEKKRMITVFPEISLIIQAFQTIIMELFIVVF